MSKKAIGCVITDTHLKESNIELVKDIFRQAIKITKDLGFDTLYHGGDIFDSRKAQPLAIQKAFEEILGYFREAKIKLVTAVGNHDKTSYQHKESFLDAFHLSPHLPHELGDSNKYFEVVDLWRKFRLSDKIDIHLTPFFEDKEYIENMQQANQWINPKLKNIHLTHIGFEGSVMNSGMSIKGGVGKSIADLFDLTLVGHYHDYQELYDGSVIYIGSAYQSNFGENNKKGLTVIYDDLSIEQIKLKFPEYIKYEVDIDKLTSSEIVSLKQEKEESGNIIRVYLTGSEEKVNSFNRQELLNAGIEVEKRIDQITKIEIEQEVEKFEVSSITDAFDTFCTRKKLDLNKGLEYLKKGLNVQTSIS